MNEHISSGPRGIKGRRRSIDLATGDLVRTEVLAGIEGTMPLVVQPNLTGVDLASWAEHNADQFETWLVEHGAVVFRGFGLTLPPEFEAVVSGLFNLLK